MSTPGPDTVRDPEMPQPLPDERRETSHPEGLTHVSRPNARSKIMFWVGTDLSDGPAVWGVDQVEPSTVRRFLEPVESGSAIHSDHGAARGNGFDTIVAPSTSLLSYTPPAMSRPAPLLQG